MKGEKAMYLTSKNIEDLKTIVDSCSEVVKDIGTDRFLIVTVDKTGYANVSIGNFMLNRLGNSDYTIHCPEE